ncbi:MAG: ATP-binding protein [Solobacterium sp.]|jgi:primosomal protein DnaI|nr:ATP-binding protein [Solobacterium sp.]MCH4204937.1 ATP-binding protein [Solobacterium sp.]MCH4226329.1 ATP-binding protein [Solobacterium sp.]MCH4281730.1 ATP-binding protein [Solobacterium sp.]
MEKADFTIHFSPEKTAEMAKETEALVQSLKKDPQIHSLIERGDIDASCIEKHPWTLHAWLNEFAPCIGCRGLAFCRQKTAGYFSSIHEDGMLQKSMQACKYMRKQLETEAHMKNYASDDLPKNMRTVSLADIDIAEESQEYAKVLTKVLQCSEAYGSMYLYGNMGTGKTYLAAGACNDHARNNEHVAFVHYPSFCMRMASMVMNNEYRSELERLKAVKFLVIDDIGAESVTAWNRDSILLPLLNARYDASLATWFTSNCDLASLKIHLTFSTKGSEDELKAERILERIETMCEIEALTGKDRRK